MKRMAINIIIGITLLCAVGIARPAAPRAEDDFQLIKVADGVFGAIAKPGGLASGNAGFIVGDDGVLVVDTFLTPHAMEELIAQIELQTKLPIKYAVNTHYHLDHTGGNQLLAARRVPIIGQQNVLNWVGTKNRRFLPVPDELRKRAVDVGKELTETPEDQKEKRTQLQRRLRQIAAMSAIKLTPPSLTYNAGTIRLYLGSREVVLFTLPGHTGGDTLVYVPDANVVFTGDMGWSKTLPNLVDATVNDWVPSLDKLLSEHGGAKFVPGHGEVAGAAEMREFRDYLDDLRSRVKQAISGGLTVEQAKEQLKLPEKYKGFAFQNFAQPNVEDMYKELKGSKQTQ